MPNAMRLRRAIERFKDMGKIVGSNAATFVLDSKHKQSRTLRRAECDCRTRLAVLGRVVQKIVHQLAEQRQLRSHPIGAVGSGLELQIRRPRVGRPRLQMIRQPCRTSQSLPVGSSFGLGVGASEKQQHFHDQPQMGRLFLDQFQDAVIFLGRTIAPKQDL